MLPRNSCELCKGPASLYCYSDSAFLCWSCDRHVHSANFLVSRHVRQFACSNCHSFSLALIGSGSDNPIQSTCLSCSPSSPCSSVTSESGCEPEPENGTSAAVWHVPRELDRTCREMARRKGEVRGEEGWGEFVKWHVRGG